MARGRAQNGGAKPVHGTRGHLGFAGLMVLAADTLRTQPGPSDDSPVALELLFLTPLSKAVEAQQPILDKPGRLQRAFFRHLRAYVHERCTPGWAA